jgi:hypothetical protein
MTIVRLETVSLFVKSDEDISTIVPKFTRVQLENIQYIGKEEYHITLGAGGSGIRYSVRLPNTAHVTDGLRISISRLEGNEFYGNYVSILNEFVKEVEQRNKEGNSITAEEKEAYDWLCANTRELNIAKLYWQAVNLREIAELSSLKANLALLDAKAYMSGKCGMSGEERKLAVTEYGYDPEKSYGY